MIVAVFRALCRTSQTGLLQKEKLWKRSFLVCLGNSGVKNSRGTGGFECNGKAGLVDRYLEGNAAQNAHQHHAFAALPFP